MLFITFANFQLSVGWQFFSFNPLISVAGKEVICDISYEGFLIEYGFDDFWWLLIYYHLRTSCSIIFCSESVNKKFQVYIFDQSQFKLLRPATIITAVLPFLPLYCLPTIISCVLLAHWCCLCVACLLLLLLCCLPTLIASVWLGVIK